MNSGGHRGFTVVTIVTLLFAPIFAHHHWMWKLVGVKQDTQVVQCARKAPCPKKQTIVRIERTGQPTPPPHGRQLPDSNDPSAVDDPNSLVGSYDGNRR
jgi:hypothetical protein